MVTYVESGQVVSGDCIYYGDSQHIQDGGVASATTIIGGGQYVSSGGLAISTDIEEYFGDYGFIEPGNQYVLSGGVASATTISSGGGQHVLSGGVASGTTVKIGGQLHYYLGGMAENVTFEQGAEEHLHNGIVVQDGSINGLHQVLSSGASALKTTVNMGGVQTVLFNAKSISATVAKGGSQVVKSGGVTSAVTVQNGGLVTAAGLVTTAKVQKGGKLVLKNKGTATGVTLLAGAALTVSSGATAGIKSMGSGAALALKAGGTLNLAAGKVFSGRNTLASGTVTGGTKTKRVALAKNATLTVGAKTTMNKLHLDVSNGTLKVTGTGNTLGSLKLNKTAKVSYDVSKLAAKGTAYMLTLSAKNTQKLGAYSVNVKKGQGLGVYELSKNIVQAKNTAYTVNLAGTKQGTAKLNGPGLIKGTAIYAVDSGKSNTISLTVAKTGKTFKGTAKKDTFKGTANWDVFYGGKGNDSIKGVNGRDVVVYDKTAWGQDSIAKTSGCLTLVFKNLKARDIVERLGSRKVLTITRKSDPKQQIVIQGWNDATHKIVFASGMTAFDKYLKAAKPGTAQVTAARNEAFKKAGLASA